MSQKVGYEFQYAVNEGDSPVNISQVSEGSTASPIRISPVQKCNQISNINYLSNLKHSLNQYNSNNRTEQDQDQSQQYEYNPNNNTNTNDPNGSYSQSGAKKRGTLTGMMKGMTPKEFAASQVYGMSQSTRNLTSNKLNAGTSKSLQSVNLNGQQGQTSDKLETIDNINSLEDITHGQNYNYQSQDLQVSKYTERSQALMKELLDTGIIRKNERPQSQSQQYNKAANMLLSEENMYQYEKENKKKAHQRVYSSKEQDIINRLYGEHEQKQRKNQESKKEYEEQQIRECTFSPRLFRSHFNSGSNFNYGNSTQESQYYSKREPNFYEQSQKMKTLYENHKDILKDAKENEEKQFIQEKPKLTRRTQQYSEQAFEKKGIKSLSVIDRLYQEKKQPDLPQETHPFKPTISHHAKQKQRKEKIDVYLYKDAKRRKEVDKQSQSFSHSNQKQSNLNTQSTNGQQQTTPSTYNPATHKKNHQKAITSKFDKDFQQAVADMAFTKDPNRRNMPETISYLEVIEILQNLKFINQQSLEENQIIATQVQRVWNQLTCRHDKTRILVRNLEVFLFAVQNIRADAEMIPFITEEQLNQENANTIHHKSNQLNPDDSSPHSHFNSQHLQQSQQEMEKINKKLAERGEMINSKLSESKKQAIGFFDSNDNLYYADELVTQIHRQFKDIYDNRLTGEKGSRRISKNNEPIHTFAPEISETSRRMAQERRDRVVDDLKRNEGFDGNLDINEILIYQKQLTKFQNEELKQKLEDDKMNECTFHPQTKDFSKVEKYFSPRHNQNGNNFEEEMQGKITSERKQGTSTKPLGVHRTLELYSLAKPQNQRRDRDKGDIEYEKECDECTFSPDISHIKLANFNSSISSQYNTYNSPNKSKQLTNVQQKGIQKNIDRLKNARLNTKVNEQLINSGTTFSNKQRQSLEKLVNISLQSEKHTHERPNGRFISTNSTHSNNPRVVSSSPKPPLFSPQETQDYNHQMNDPQDHADTARSGKSQPNQGDNQEISEYVLKQPQQVAPNEREKSQINSKTMEEDRVPLLFVDVNIEDGKTARIIVYEGEKSEDLANKFAQEHNLDSVMTGRLKDLLDQQINSLLTKIDEEVGSDREEEEESGEDEQGNYIHRRRHKKKQMIGHIDNDHQHQEHEHDHEQEHEQEHEEDEEDRDETPQQQHIVYTEDNFDFMSNQNRFNNPNLQNTGDSDLQVQTIKDSGKKIVQQEEEDDKDHIQRSKQQQQQQQPQRNEQDIMEMHMKALAQTYKNYQDSDEKQKQLPEEKKMSAKEIEDMHLKALATTYKNYSESEDKQKNLPTDHQKVTLADMENMHMKALAATFNNYSQDANKYNSLPPIDSNLNSWKPNQYEAKDQSAVKISTPTSSSANNNAYANQYSYPSNSYNNNNNYNDTSTKTQQYTEPPKNPQDIIDMHMKALASTYKNYSDQPDKFGTSSSQQLSSTSYQYPDTTSYQYPDSTNKYGNYTSNYGANSSISLAIPPSPYSASNPYSGSVGTTYGVTSSQPYGIQNSTSSSSYNPYSIPNSTATTYGTTLPQPNYGGLTNQTAGLNSNPYSSSTNYNNPYSYTNNTAPSYKY